MLIFYYSPARAIKIVKHERALNIIMMTTWILSNANGKSSHYITSLPSARPSPAHPLSLLQFNFTNSRALNSRTLLFASYQSSATAPAEVGVVGCWMASGDWGRALGLSFPFNRPTALPLLLLLLLLMRFLSSLCMATYLSPAERKNPIRYLYKS